MTQKIKLRRLILDSQSLNLFIGKPDEQSFDQRAGLCQGGPRDIVVTTNPFNPTYLCYWQGLGYKLPKLVVAGPFEPDASLSDLIRRKLQVQKEILQYKPTRIEIFHPSNREELLFQSLPVQPYVNLSFSQQYQMKNEFKRLFLKAGVPTLPFLDMTMGNDLSWSDLISEFNSNELIAKKIYGSGGKSLGMITPLSSEEDFLQLYLEEGYIIEPQIKIKREIAVHWEIMFNGTVRFIGYFGQIGKDLSYVGTEFPIKIDPKLKQSLDNGFQKLTSEIAKLGGLGFMCCDVLVDQDNNIYWSDLNPRKGAILFIFDAIRRLKRTRHLGKVFILHKHFSGTRISSFEEVQQKLGKLLNPENYDGFVLITNPGAIQYGYLDVTCICRDKSNTDLLMQQVESLIY